MKHLFLLNPAAGQRDRTAELTQKIEDFCRTHGLDFEIRVSAAPGDCTSFARSASETGEELRIYACGGDGTLNEVVSGAAGFENAAVAHFPCGSGNDFIRIFGDTAPFSDLEQLLDPAESKLDLIAVNDRWSINIASIGVDARIAVEAQQYKRLPGVNGSGAYLISVVTNLFKGIHRPYEIEIDGERFDGEQSLMCVCNGRFYGGGMCPMPDAQPDDGLLDVLLVRAVAIPTFAKLFGKYKSGHYAELPEYARHFRAKSVTVRANEESIINLDGEGYRATEVRFSVAPQALRFFYPKSVFYRG